MSSHDLSRSFRMFVTALAAWMYEKCAAICEILGFTHWLPRRPHRVSLLHELVEKVETSNADGPGAVNYTKANHSTGEGERFEERMVALVFLRCLREGLLFLLSANNDDAGKFDDIVLVWRRKENPESHTLLAQLKHKTSSNAMIIQPKTWLSEAKKCVFGLRMYSTSYEEISKQLDTKRVTCVLVTNAHQGKDSLHLFHECKKDSDVDSHSRDRPKDNKASDVDSDQCVELIKAGGTLYRLKREKQEVQKAVRGTTDFVDRFYALCGQRNSEGIMSDICEELKELLGAGDQCESIGNSLCVSIRAWMNEESVCLTRGWTKWQALVDEYVRDHVTESRSVTARLSFDLDSVGKVLSYVESHNPAWVGPPEPGTGALSATKVHQALGRKTHIMVHVTRFTVRKRQILCCWGPFCRWLVIVDDDREDSHVILNDLLKMRNNERRLVIVSSRENNCFRDEYNPEEIRDTSWEELLDTSVKLNGEQYDCCLRDLVAEVNALKALLDGRPALLLALARLSHPLRMGQKLETPPEYYVPRKLVDWRPVTDRFFSSEWDWDVCITNSVSYESLKDIIGSHSVQSCDMESWLLPATELETPLILLNNDPATPGPNCRRQSGFEIYIVRKISDGRWKVHHYSAVPRGIRENSGDLVEQLLETSDTISNVVIVEGRPGVGKSTLLSDVAKRIKEMNSAYWVLRLNLRKFYSELRCSGSADSAVEEMLKKVTEQDDLGRLKYILLRHSLLKNPQVICLVDGFDEVCPDYENVCLNVLDQLKPRFGKLVVTTRPAVARILEDRAKVSAHSLEPFSLSELEEFFSRHQSTNRIPPVSNLHKRLRDLLRIPLFAKMYVDVSQYTFETYDIVRLYDAFFENKYMAYHKDTLGDDLDAPEKEKQIKSTRDWHEKQLMLLAASVLLHSTQLPEEPSFESDYFVKPGIVFHFTNGKPEFLHKTFAEHFLAKWCFDGAGQSIRATAFREAYLNESLEFFRESFDRRAASGRPVLEALLPVLLGGDVANVAALLDSGANLAETDERGGRNALHLAAGYSEERSLPLLKRLCRRGGSAALSTADRLLGWTPLRYAAERGHCDSVEELVAAGGDLSHLGDFAADPHDATQLQEIFQQDRYHALYRHVFLANHALGEVEAVPQDTMPQMEFAVSVISANMEIDALKSILLEARDAGHMQVFNVLSKSHNRRRIKPILEEARKTNIFSFETALPQFETE